MTNVWFLTIVFLASICLAEYDIDDTILYKIEFPGPLKKPDADSSTSSDPTSGGSSGDQINMASPDHSLFNEDLEEVVVTSVDKEQYACKLPRVDPKGKKGGDEYTGPTVLGLLEQLFTQQTCAYRLESYWTYELCHGRHLRQYHEEREGKSIKMQEYNLGKFTKEMFEELVTEHEKDKANGITRHPPTKKIENMNMPYYEVRMSGGTLCDLNQQPRQTRVLYVCYPAGKNEIYSLKEVSTCEYEVVVLTASLCSHPDYKPTESSEHGISCRPIGEGTKSKPTKLGQLELEGLKMRSSRMFEAHMSGGDFPGQVKIQIKPVSTGSVEEVATEEIDDKETNSHQWKESARQPFKPLMDPAVVKEFLKGDYCLYGGSGWWKYEFCYGKKVDQYHEEGGSKKTIINLGNFNEVDHLAWLEEHQAKRPKPVEARKQVSHFYSNGEICDLTGKPRQIEVKMKCKPADSPSTVSLYLLEPRTCEYVLGVESPLVCDLLSHADSQTGIFPTDLVDTLNDEKDIDGLKIVREGVVKEIEEFLGGVDTEIDSVIVQSNEEQRVETKETTSIKDGVKVVVKKVYVDGMIVKQETETTREGVTKVTEVENKDGVTIKHTSVKDENAPDNEDYVDAGAYYEENYDGLDEESEDIDDDIDEELEDIDVEGELNDDNNESSEEDIEELLFDKDEL